MTQTADRYAGMTWQAAWDDYFERHPEVLASWRYSNGHWPHDDLETTE